MSFSSASSIIFIATAVEEIDSMKPITDAAQHFAMHIKVNSATDEAMISDGDER